MMVTIKNNIALGKTIHDKTMLSTNELDSGRKKLYFFPMKAILNVIIIILNVTIHP